MKKLNPFLLTLATFLPLFLVLYNYTFDPKLFLGGDNAGYYILGKAISTGEGYTNIHLTGNPVANHFPPGYPFLIAIFMKIFSDSIFALKVFNGFFLLFSIILSYLIVKKVSNSKPLAIVTTVLIAFNSHFLYYGSIIMSEIPMCFFSLLAIYILLLVDLDKKIWSHSFFWGLVFTIAGIIYIRTSGIALLGAVVCYFLIKKKWLHSFVLFCSVALLLLPWQLRSYHLGGGAYTSQLLSKNPYKPAEGLANASDILERFFNNATRYISMELTHSIIPSFNIQYINKEGAIHSGDLTSWLLGSFLLFLIIYGVIQKNNRQIHLMIGFVLVFTMCILLLWPQVWYGIRFIMPLIPLLTYLALRGLEGIILRLITKIRKTENQPKWIPYLFLVLVAALIPKVKETHSIANRSYKPNFTTFFQLSSYASYLPDSSVIVCRKPALFFIEAQKTMTGFLYTDDYEAQIERFREKNVTHVVLDQLGYRQTNIHLAPFLQHYSGKFKMIHKTTQPVNYLFAFNDALGYHGGLVDGKRSGHGVFKWEDGSFYEGDWAENKRNGLGTLYAANGNTIKCNWKDDKKNGNGIVVLKDSSYIRMSWKNDIPDSMGVQYTKDHVFVKNLLFKAKL